MRTYLVNIGLALPTGGAITADKACEALTAAGFAFCSSTVVASQTEQTLVALVTFNTKARGRDTYGAFFRVAEQCGRECIAVYSVMAERGALIGPKAATWGAFDPEYFYLANGDTLA